MEDMLSAVVFRGDEGEVLRQASAVVGRPVVLWEIIGPHQAVPRASSMFARFRHATSSTTAAIAISNGAIAAI